MEVEIVADLILTAECLALGPVFLVVAWRTDNVLVGMLLGLWLEQLSQTVAVSPEFSGVAVRNIVLREQLA